MDGINDKFWEFVDANLKVDASKLRLKYHAKSSGDFDINLAITQIECRHKFGKKLAETLSKHPHWIFASTLAGEQATSDLLAEYHATLITQGESVVDLTAGLGIDAEHLSQKAGRITAVEYDTAKAAALKYNFEGTEVSIVNDDCRNYLTEGITADTLFIDPARRAEDGQRVYSLADCQPDVISMLPDMKKAAKKLIVKMSPMLDISQTLRQLPGTQRIIALGTETECKELIAIINLHEQKETTPIITAVTLTNDGKTIESSHTTEQEREADIIDSLGTPKEGDYIYDPFPAMMKAAAFKVIALKYGVKKISPNTHLYFSDRFVPDFPGHIYKVQRIVPYGSKYLKRFKKDYPRINITTRNFDVAADKLRAQLGVKDNDSMRLFAVTLKDGAKMMIVTSKTESR